MQRLRLTVFALAVLAPALGAQVFEPETVLPTYKGVSCAVPGDMDGNGLPDLVVAETYGNRVVLVRQTSPWVWQAEEVVSTAWQDPWHVVVEDLDGDGDLDIVVTGRETSSADGGLGWIENDGTGLSWTDHPLGIPADFASGLLLLDVDLDGDRDLFAVSSDTDSLFMVRNVGGGSFAPAVTVASFPGKSPRCVGSGDLDGDGWPDLLVGCNAQPGNLYSVRNLKGSGFGAPVEFDNNAQGPGSVTTCDLDGDGDQDVLCASRDNNTVRWFQNDGTGTLGSGQFLASQIEPMMAVGFDADVDGIPDLFVASAEDDTVAWYKGLGGGAFGPQKVLSSTADGAYFLAFGDLDGDGDEDLLVPAKFDSTLHLYRRDVEFPGPILMDAIGLHCAEAGTAVLMGANLVGASVAVDGEPVPVLQSTDDMLTIQLQPQIPGRRCDVDLDGDAGSTSWPDALPRYPVLSCPATVGLGETLEVSLENSDAGYFALGASPAIYATPAPFAGWFHGLELCGVWILASDVCAPGSEPTIVTVAGVSDPDLVGVEFYLQAWTQQVTLDHVGFTAVSSVTVE